MEVRIRFKPTLDNRRAGNRTRRMASAAENAEIQCMG